MQITRDLYHVTTLENFMRTVTNILFGATRVWLHSLNRLVNTQLFGWFDKIIVKGSAISQVTLSSVVRRTGGCGGGRTARWCDTTHKRPDVVKVRLVGRPSTAIVSILRLVLLQMPVEVRLLPEATVAVATPERSLLIVNVSHVPL